eukprot:gene17456-20829_t
MTIYICPIHVNKKTALYCQVCSVLVCTKCIVSTHQGHQFNKPEDLQKEKIEKLKKRKVDAWTEARSLTSMLDDEFQAFSSTTANNQQQQLPRDASFPETLNSTQKMSKIDFRLMVEKFSDVGDFIREYRSDDISSQISNPQSTFMAALDKYDIEYQTLPPIKKVRFDFRYNISLLQKVLNDLRETYEMVIDDLTDDRGFIKKYQEKSTISYIFSLCGMEALHLNHVEQYDIANERWGSSEPAKMKRACSSASVEGLNPYQLVNNIEAFNTKDSSSTILFTFGGNEILSKTIHKLAKCPLKEGKIGLSLVFGFNEGFKVYVIGGKDKFQYYYNIDLGSWHEMPNKTKQTYFHGAVVLICAKCVVSTHQGHIFKELGDMQKERIEKLKKRKVDAWTEARSLTSMLDEYDGREKKIHSFFEEAHRMLMLDERKLSGPILEEKKKIETRLTRILAEIDHISACETLAERATGDATPNTNTTQPTQSSSSEFYAFSSTTANQQQQLPRDASFPGTLSAIQNMSKIDFRLMVEKYSDVDDFIRENRSDDISSQTPNPQSTFMAALDKHDTDYQTLPPITKVSFHLKYDNISQLQKVLNDLSEIYKKVIDDLPEDRGFVKRYQEESTINYIFSLCGMEGTQHLNRVDQYEIASERWGSSEPAKMKRACSSASEGLNPFQLVNNIEAFNTKDSTSKIIFTFGGNERVEGCCFDKREYIYFITNSIFCRFSVLTKSIHKLAKCPLKEGKFGLSLVFGFNEGFKVFVIGGKDNFQYYYNIDLGSWHELPKKTKQTYFHGAIGVRSKP